MLKVALRWLLVAGALALAALPAIALLGGREEMVRPFGAVALAALCSFLAYRVAVVLRQRIDAIGAASPHARPPADPDS